MPVTSSISARQLMTEIVARSALDLIERLKRHHNNNENLIMRDLKSLHSNTSYEDLPEYLKQAVGHTTQAMFGYINKHGFVLVPKEKR